MIRKYRGKYPHRVHSVGYSRNTGWHVTLNNGETHRPMPNLVVKAFPVHGIKLGMDWSDVRAALETAAAAIEAEQAAASLPHASELDREAILATVQAILSAGYAVRIIDGALGEGAPVYGPGTDASAAIATMASTESDLVQVWADDVRIGSFSLIYGMDDAAETVADYSYSWRREAETSNRSTMDRLHAHIMGRLGEEG